MADKTIVCIGCKSEFVFSEREQEFYKEKGFQNEPQRCPECRAARKKESRGNNRGGGSRKPDRQMFPAICAECGEKTMVPFKPNGEKPVYCKDCYQPSGRR